MHHLFFRLLPKAALGSLLALGIATGIATTSQPAQAGVIVSVGFGGGYAPAPAYHWHRWHDGYGWHRRWVPLGWAPPVAILPQPVYFRPLPVAYYRPYRGPGRYDRWAAYGPENRWASYGSDHRARWADARTDYRR